MLLYNGQLLFLIHLRQIKHFYLLLLLRLNFQPLRRRRLLLLQ
jgi:hypothetical protein